MGIPNLIWQRLARLCCALAIALSVLFPVTAPVVAASGGDRTLYLHHTHTGETGRFTFRKNGKYDQKALRDLNIFLADWRTKEPTKMDPALFDLLWTVYQDVGASQPINIVSSYRSPKTNAMLRAKSSGVAENSQHTKGKAIDFFIPGVKLATLREAVMRRQVGGIGYYPTSGSPFVHADTGSVRAWPRMTRAQLKKVFPDGKTLHLPTDGSPLSSKGRAYAEAEWRKCHAVPCNGSPFTGSPLPAETATPDIMIADAEPPVPLQRPGRTYGEQGEGIMTAALAEPTQRTVATIEVAPSPLARPTFAQAYAEELAAPVPAPRPARLMLASTGSGSGALDAIDSSVPQPRVLMSPRDDAQIVAAYAPGNATLETLIEDAARAPLATALRGGKDGITTASLGGADMSGIFDQTFAAVSSAVPVSAAEAVRVAALDRQPNLSIDRRNTDLVAPELDHVNQTLTTPLPLTTGHFAELYEAEGYLDKGAELGAMANRMDFLPDLGQPLDYARFVANPPLLTALR